MPIETRCPLCGARNNNGNDSCSEQIGERGHVIRCVHYNIACVMDESVREPYGFDGVREACRRYNAVVAFLRQNPYPIKDEHRYWRFFYEEQTVGKPISLPKSGEGAINYNIANEMIDYPRNFQQKIDRVLLALSSKYSKIGFKIVIDGHDRALYYVSNFDPVENIQEIRGMLDRLVELAYLKGDADNSYEITAGGWVRISELSRMNNEINQGFIAMAFNDSTQKIGQAFFEAISECGYKPCRIDQKEHNNQIVPEIFFEIKRSKFLVVDVSCPNLGAYYEAGYGEALNKQVIVCCSKEVFESKDRPHFDIAQKNSIVWADLEELKINLKRRIEATVGLNQKVANFPL